MSERLFPTPSRILVALDGSEHSKKAVEMAIDCANKWHAELYVIHVLEEKKIPKELEVFPVPRTERISPEEYFAMVCSTFIGEAEARAKAAGVKKVERICVIGDPADEMLRREDRLSASSHH